MQRTLIWTPLGVFFLLALGGCHSGGREPLSCVSDLDCPRDCFCHASATSNLLCRYDDDDNYLCGGSCTTETVCPPGTVCRVTDLVRRHGEDNIYVYDCAPPTGTGGTGGGGGGGGIGGAEGECAPLGSRLLILLDWEGSGVNLDLGGETPEANEPHNNIGAGDPSPDKDPNCEHDGDEPHTSGMTKEQAVCQPLDTAAGTYTGIYTIRVDNFDSAQQDFDLLVTIDGNDVPGYPRSGTVPGEIDGEGGFVHETFCLE